MGMEDKKRKVLDKEYEELLTVGEGTVSEAQSVLKNKEEEQKIHKEIELETLRKASQFQIVTYTRLLAGLLLKRLEFIEWPTGWRFNVAPTDKGVVLEMKSPTGRYFRSAFKAVGMSQYDLNAIDTFANMAENTIDKLTPKNDGQRFTGK